MVRDDQRLEEGGRDQEALFVSREEDKVPYRSSEFTREILHSRWNQRVVGEEVIEGRVKIRTRSQHQQVLLRSKSEVERRHATQRRKDVSRSRDKEKIHRWQLAVVFFSCGENFLAVWYLSGIRFGKFHDIDYS